MKNFEDFVEKMKKTIPDPIVSFLTTKPRMSVRQFKIISEKGQLLEIHLLEKSARHQNRDCSTAFEQIA
jgi:hypothetical protein